VNCGKCSAICVLIQQHRHGGTSSDRAAKPIGHGFARLDQTVGLGMGQETTGELTTAGDHQAARDPPRLSCQHLAENLTQPQSSVKQLEIRDQRSEDRGPRSEGRDRSHQPAAGAVPTPCRAACRAPCACGGRGRQWSTSASYQPAAPARAHAKRAARVRARISRVAAAFSSLGRPVPGPQLPALAAKRRHSAAGGPRSIGNTRTCSNRHL
jgi:hypothetical protein